MEKVSTDTRDKILAVALKLFADRGYAGASVQDIVDGARVTKPALYYYFSSKSALYQALLDRAHDERYRLMREAAGQGTDLARQLEEILVVLFDFLRKNRDLVRLSFATAFAAKGEMPREIRYLDKCQRNFDFVCSLIKQAQKGGGLDRKSGYEDLTRGFFGLMNIYVMGELVQPKLELNRRVARRIVQLFLNGAAARK